jgi:hypothetical protein
MLVCAKGRARGHRPYRHKKTDYSITTFSSSEQKGRRSNEGMGRIIVFTSRAWFFEVCKRIDM